MTAFVGKWAPPPREETAEERNERITKEILSQPGYQKGMRKS